MELQRNRTATMSDEKIVDLYWQRDEQAIKETDIKYKRFLLSLANNIVHDMCDSEECLNDTYRYIYWRVEFDSSGKTCSATIISRNHY